MSADPPLAIEAYGLVKRYGDKTALAGVDLEHTGVEIEDLGLRQPTLDDAFLALTGKPAEAAEPVAADARESA